MKWVMPVGEIRFGTYVPRVRESRKRRELRVLVDESGRLVPIVVEVE